MSVSVVGVEASGKGPKGAQTVVPLKLRTDIKLGEALHTVVNENSLGFHNYR